MVEAVVWDIGSVLIAWSPAAFYDEAIGRERRERLDASVDTYRMNREIELGAVSHAVVGDFATAHPEWQREILLWQQRWIGFVRHDIPVSSRLLRALRAKGVPVFALSIFGLGKLAEVRARFPVLGEFDRQFNSGAPSFIKPDPSIYAGLEGGIGPAGESLIFADDSRACIGAAEAPGWKNAHHFSDPDAWAARLAEEGLLSPMVWEE